MNDSIPLDHEEIIRRIGRDLADSYDEELEMEIEDHHPLPGVPTGSNGEAEREYRRQYSASSSGCRPSSSSCRTGWSPRARKW